MSLGGIIILDDFDAKEFKELGEPYTTIIMFEVADDVSKIRVNDTLSSISNKKVSLRVNYKVKCRQITSPDCRAMLNGYFIQKC